MSCARVVWHCSNRCEHCGTSVSRPAHKQKITRVSRFFIKPDAWAEKYGGLSLCAMTDKTIKQYWAVLHEINLHEESTGRKPFGVFHILLDVPTTVDVDQARSQFLTSKTSPPLCLVYGNILSIPLSFNMIYKLDLCIFATAQDKPKDLEAPTTSAPKLNENHKKKTLGTRAFKSLYTNHSHDKNGQVLSTASGNIKLASSFKNSVRAHLSCDKSTHMEVHPLITSQMYSNPKYSITQPSLIGVNALTEIMANTFISMQCGWLASDKKEVTEDSIKHMHSKYKVPNVISSGASLAVPLITTPRYDLHACASLIQFNPKSQFVMNWIKATIQYNTSTNVLDSLRMPETTGILKTLVEIELDTYDQIQLSLQKLPVWFKHFGGYGGFYSMSSTGASSQINSPLFHASMGHLRTFRIVFKCAQAHPLLFVQLEPLWIRNASQRKAGKQPEASNDKSGESFYSISLLESLPQVKVPGFVFKDTQLNIPFFDSVSSVVECTYNITDSMI